METMWNTCLKSMQPQEVEVRIRELRSGTFRFHLLRIIPVKSETVIKSWVGTFTDIDDQKQEERKKDEFLSIASHEIKTPLTSIKAYIQLIARMENKQPESKVAAYINRAHDQVSKLDGLINNLLDVSQRETFFLIL